MVERRNIILITFDSLRADHCSFMGYHRETTPTLDKMARKGLYFENAIASGVPTPTSMVGVFTGDYAYVDISSADPKSWRRELATRLTIAQVLKRERYFTGAFHENPYVSSYFGFNKGFDYYYCDDTNKYKNFKLKIHDKILVPLFRKLGFSRMIPDMLMGVGLSARWESFYSYILEWINKTKKPFFLWILLLDTHIPYIPPRKYRRCSNILEIYYYNWKIGKTVRAKTKQSKEWRDKIIDAYDDCIRYADAFVKRLWEDIKDYDPILIIHADHGDGFCEHGFYYHRVPCLYEELIHVPLIIYNADVKGKVEKPVSLLGIAPTILELIGMKNEFPSESLLHGGKDWVIVKAYGGKIAVRTKEWKYIVGQKEEEELYYLKKDPHEQVNLIYEYPKLVDEFKKIVDLHIKCESEKRKIHDIARRLRYQGGTRHG